MHTRVLVCLALVAGPPLALAAPGNTMVWELATAEDFAKGEGDGVVVTGAGRLEPGAPVTPVDLGGAAVFAMAVGASGEIYAATGQPAELHVVSGGAPRRLMAGAPEDVAFTCCAVDGGGTVWVGAFPTGTLYRVRAGAEPAPVKLPDPYVWAIALDGGGAAYVGTGPEGRVYRVATGGEVTMLYDSPEKNVVSLALAPDGALLFGTAEKGLLYRRDAAGEVTVLHDFAEREVRAIVRSGERWWIGTNAPQSAFDQKEFAESLAQTLGRQASEGSAPAGERGAALKKLLKGAVWQIEGDGRVEQAFALEKNYLLGLAPDGGGGVHVACGAEGRVYRVVPGAVGPEAHLVFDLRDGQVLALGAHNGRLASVGGGGPGRCLVVGARRTGGTYLSPVHDAQAPARFGTIAWNGRGTFAVETRQGNTAEPDASWSAWRAPDAGGAIAGPRARYLQFRIRFADDPDAWVDRVTATLLPDNRRPVLRDVKIGTKSRGASFPIGDLQNEKRIKIAFKAEDPDGDTVAVRFFYRAEGAPEGAWIPVTAEPIEKTPYDWDTTDVPDGVYRLRVVAEDAPVNTPARTLAAAWLSRPLIIDNTPPLVTNLRLVRGASGIELRGQAMDAASPIVRLEVARETGAFVQLLPDDGNFDGLTEPFTLEGVAAAAATPVRVRVRVTDAAGNTRVVQESLAAP